MKSDEDVRMISAEAPVLFAKVQDLHTEFCVVCQLLLFGKLCRIEASAEYLILSLLRHQMMVWTGNRQTIELICHGYTVGNSVFVLRH